MQMRVIRQFLAFVGLLTLALGANLQPAIADNEGRNYQPEYKNSRYIPMARLGIDAPGVLIDPEAVDLKSHESGGGLRFLRDLAERVEGEGGGVIVSTSETAYDEDVEASTSDMQLMQLPGTCTLRNGLYFTKRTSTYSTLTLWARNDCPGAYNHRLNLDLQKRSAGSSSYYGTNVAWATEDDSDAEVDYTCRTGYVAEFDGYTTGSLTYNGSTYTKTIHTGWERHACGG